MILNQTFHERRQWSLHDSCRIGDLHEYNYLLLMQLLGSDQVEKTMHFTAPSKPTLRLVRREQFRYTTEVALMMTFDDAVSDPVVLRIYHDAELVELVYSNEFERQYRQLGGLADATHQAELRFSQNCFLNKWLIFLLQNGYHKAEL